MLQKRFDSIIQLQEDFIKSHARKKRGLFNIVGEIHKILWGSLANSDLDYFNQQIVNLYNHTNEAILLQEKAVHITQDTLKTLSNDFNVYNLNLLKIEDWSNTVRTKLDALTTDNLLSEAILELEISIEDYRDYIKMNKDGIFHVREICSHP